MQSLQWSDNNITHYSKTKQHFCGDNKDGRRCPSYDHY